MRVINSIKMGATGKQYLFKLLIVFLLLFSGKAFSESNLPQDDVKISGKAYFYQIGIDGSPYFVDDWSSAELVLENGSVAKNVKIKLNLIGNELLFYNEDLKRVFVADREIVHSFSFEPLLLGKVNFVKYSGDGLGYKLKDNDFVQLLCPGDISLVVKHFGEIVEANDVSSRNKVYHRKYYFVQHGSQVAQITPRVRSFYKFFPGKKKEIRKLIRENKITRNTEPNLIRLVELINSDPKLSVVFSL